MPSVSHACFIANCSAGQVPLDVYRPVQLIPKRSEHCVQTFLASMRCLRCKTRRSSSLGWWSQARTLMGPVSSKVTEHKTPCSPCQIGLLVAGGASSLSAQLPVCNSIVPVPAPVVLDHEPTTTQGHMLSAYVCEDGLVCTKACLPLGGLQAASS